MEDGARRTGCGMSFLTGYSGKKSAPARRKDQRVDDEAVGRETDGTRTGLEGKKGVA